MKYRLTPFHFVALFFLGLSVYLFYLLSHSKDDWGLGGLAPFLMLAVCPIVLVIDFVIQDIASSFEVKPKPLIYAVEFGLIILAMLWLLRTFFPTVHRA